jgi:hypothetical protein
MSEPIFVGACLCEALRYCVERVPLVSAIVIAELVARPHQRRRCHSSPSLRSDLPLRPASPTDSSVARENESRRPSLAGHLIDDKRLAPPLLRKAADSGIDSAPTGVIDRIS